MGQSGHVRSDRTMAGGDSPSWLGDDEPSSDRKGSSQTGVEKGGLESPILDYKWRSGIIASLTH